MLLLLACVGTKEPAADSDSQVKSADTAPTWGEDVDYWVVVESETSSFATTPECSDLPTCCRELTVSVIDSQTELDDLMDTWLEGRPVPSVSFESQVALLSWTRLCPQLGYELRVAHLQQDGSALRVFHQLQVPETGDDALGRPYSLITFPAEHAELELDPRLREVSAR